jgi:hypothetical protein
VAGEEFEEEAVDELIDRIASFKANWVTPWSSLKRVSQMPTVPLLRMAGWRTLGSASRLLVGS